MRQTCFVSIPFGVKPDVQGRLLDFEHLYHEVIRPTVESAEVECRRLDEYPFGAIWHRTLFEALISSDILIAEVSTPNPNVFYELGVRHALKRGRTILVSAGNPLPGNLSYARAILYTPDADGHLTGPAAERFRQALRATIVESVRSPVNDSPIYEFFPDIEVTLPSELQTAPPRPRRRRRIKTQREFTESVIASPAKAKAELEATEAEIRGGAEADPAEYLTLLRRFRDVGDWDHVVSLADDAPPALAQAADVRQILALALYRRGREGDDDRAISILNEQIAESGGDSETFGILGLIYKDRHDLPQALHWYREAFSRDPHDSYAGLNVVGILLQQGAPKAEVDAVVPQVRAALREKLESERPDFWVLADDLQLAIVAHDWDHAEKAAEKLFERQPEGWMTTSVASGIETITKIGTYDAAEQVRLDHILSRLHAAAAGVSADV